MSQNASLCRPCRKAGRSKSARRSPEHGEEVRNRGRRGRSGAPHRPSHGPFRSGLFGGGFFGSGRCRLQLWRRLRYRDVFDQPIVRGARIGRVRSARDPDLRLLVGRRSDIVFRFSTRRRDRPGRGWRFRRDFNGCYRRRDWNRQAPAIRAEAQGSVDIGPPRGYPAPVLASEPR